MTAPANTGAESPRMRRISITVEIEIPESEFADLAEMALTTGKDLRQLIAARYGASRRKQPALRGSGSGPKVNVAAYKHLYDQAPPGERPYRGSGRPPKWLIERIEAETGSA